LGLFFSSTCWSRYNSSWVQTQSHKYCHVQQNERWFVDSFNIKEEKLISGLSCHVKFTPSLNLVTAWQHRYDLLALADRFCFSVSERSFAWYSICFYAAIAFLLCANFCDVFLCQNLVLLTFHHGNILDFCQE
jgi:hypothetical protein